MKTINQLSGKKTVMISETKAQFFNTTDDINKLINTLIKNKRGHLSILGMNEETSLQNLQK